MRAGSSSGHSRSRRTARCTGRPSRAIRILTRSRALREFQSPTGTGTPSRSTANPPRHWMARGAGGAARPRSSAAGGSALRRAGGRRAGGAALGRRACPVRRVRAAEPGQGEQHPALAERAGQLLPQRQRLGERRPRRRRVAAGERRPGARRPRPPRPGRAGRGRWRTARSATTRGLGRRSPAAQREPGLGEQGIALAEPAARAATASSARPGPGRGRPRPAAGPARPAPGTRPCRSPDRRDTSTASVYAAWASAVWPRAAWTSPAWPERVGDQQRPHALEDRRWRRSRSSRPARSGPSAPAGLAPVAQGDRLERGVAAQVGQADGEVELGDGLVVEALLVEAGAPVEADADDLQQVARPLGVIEGPEVVACRWPAGRRLGGAPAPGRCGPRPGPGRRRCAGPGPWRRRPAPGSGRRRPAASGRWPSSHQQRLVGQRVGVAGRRPRTGRRPPRA